MVGGARSSTPRVWVCVPTFHPLRRSAHSSKGPAAAQVRAAYTGDVTYVAGYILHISRGRFPLRPKAIFCVLSIFSIDRSVWLPVNITIGG